MNKLAAAYPKIYLYFQHHPLRSILFLALVIRLLAAFFSKGYAFNDDHFDVITVAQNWLYGLPHWFEPDNPPRHSIFYVVIHYVIFYVSEAIGIDSPDNKMLIVRIVHALYSVLTVYLGYRITLLISNKNNAILVGLILSFIWFMPFMSVRNLVEMVCIPPYLGAFYVMIKVDKQSDSDWKKWLLAGALFGIAFVIRYHAILFIGGAGIVLLFRRQWMEATFLSFGFILAAFIIQGSIDTLMFRYPFHSIVAYYEFNSENQNLLVVGPAYRFLLTVLGFLVPPVSLFLVYGFIKSRKIEAMMFTAALTFFAFHSFFPHKQERFILPLFPLIIILGVIGWNGYVKRSSFWMNRKKILRYSWTFFWVLNITASLALAFTYSKKSRIAPLSYLSEKKDMDAMLLETLEEGVSAPPSFYLGKVSAVYDDLLTNEDNAWKEFREQGRHHSEDFVMIYELGSVKSTDTLKAEIQHFQLYPDYIIFSGRERLEERVSRLRDHFPGLKLEKEITPSLYDQLLHFLNPRVHEDEFISIYQVIGKEETEIK